MADKKMGETPLLAAANQVAERRGRHSGMTTQAVARIALRAAAATRHTNSDSGRARRNAS